MSKVLVIESNAILRLDITQLLASNGHQPLEADSGEQGLEMATCETPDVILCSTRLSDLDGFEVLQQVRSQSGQTQPYFILLFSNPCSPVLRRALQLGANDALGKPIDTQELLEAVSMSTPSSN